MLHYNHHNVNLQPYIWPQTKTHLPDWNNYLSPAKPRHNHLLQQPLRCLSVGRPPIYHQSRVRSQYCLDRGITRSTLHSQSIFCTTAITIQFIPLFLTTSWTNIPQWRNMRRQAPPKSLLQKPLHCSSIAWQHFLYFEHHSNGTRLSSKPYQIRTLLDPTTPRSIL